MLMLNLIALQKYAVKCLMVRKLKTVFNIFNIMVFKWLYSWKLPIKFFIIFLKTLKFENIRYLKCVTFNPMIFSSFQLKNLYTMNSICQKEWTWKDICAGSLMAKTHNEDNDIKVHKVCKV